MHIYLECNNHLNTDILDTYNPELDNIMSLLDTVCDSMHDNKEYAFQLIGFREDKWSLDNFDLSVFLEQLPFSLQAIRNKRIFDIDLYEQGTEKILHFVPMNNIWEVKCLDLVSRKLDPSEAVELITTEELLIIMETILDRFMLYIKPLRDSDNSWNKVIDDWLTCRWKPK